MRIVYMINHSGLLLGELETLKLLDPSIYEIYNDAENGKLVETNPNQIIDQHQDYPTIFFVYLSQMRLITHFHPNHIFVCRLFGREAQLNYHTLPIFKLIKPLLDSQVMCLGVAYHEVINFEPMYFQTYCQYLPLTLKSTLDTYRLPTNQYGSKSSIFFQCSQSSSIYYNRIYQQFKTEFQEFPYQIYGKRLGSSQIDIIFDLSDKDYYTAMCAHKVMFYHSQEIRHVHFHPIEAIYLDVPVIYMNQSLLGHLIGQSVGGCNNYNEARTKIRQILNDDPIFISQVKSENKKILCHFSNDNYLKAFQMMIAKSTISNP